MEDIINNISFSDRQYMLKVIDFIDSLIIKCDYDASVGETVESKRAGNAYVLAVKNKDTIYDYKLTYDELRLAGISTTRLKLFKEDMKSFLNSMTTSEERSILNFYRNKRIEEYVETNPYYLLLNGEPVNESEYAYVRDIYENGYYPIHLYSDTFHQQMYQYLTNYNNQELLNILDLFKENGVVHDYFEYLTKRTSYADSRSANNFDILYYDSTILNERDMHNFFTEYERAREYVLTVPYIKSYAEEMELYDRFTGCTILFIALMNFMSLKIDSVMRNEVSTREEKIAFFKDYDMESIVNELSDSQLDILIENMEQLIPLKGSEEVITKILELFGIDNINVYKYLLFKTIKSNQLTKDVELDPKKSRSENYELSLVKIPINTAEETDSVAKYIKDTSSHTNPDAIFSEDKYFGDTEYSGNDTGDSPKLSYIKEVEDKLKNSEEFSYFYTKYIGIISHINITQALIKATYLFQQLLHDEDSLDTKCQLDEVPANLTCRDLVAAINYIVTLRFNMDDTIINDPTNISRIMGFNPTPSLRQLKEMSTYVIDERSETGESVSVVLPSTLSQDDIFVVKNHSYQSTDDMPSSFGGGGGGMILLAAAPNNKSLCVTDYEYNIQKHDELLEKIAKTTDYTEYCALQQVFNYNMYAMAALDIFNGYDTYSSYLQSNVVDLYKFIQDTLNSATDSQWDNLDGTARTDTFINTCIELTSLFVDSILLAIGSDSEVNDAVKNTYVDNTSIFSKIFSIINLFKSYTTQFSNTDIAYTINTNKDCLIKVFDMLNAHKGGDVLKESLYDLIYHQLAGGGDDKGEDLIELKCWIDEHFKSYNNEELNITHLFEHLKLNEFGELVGGNTGRFDEPITVNEKIKEESSDKENHKLIVKELVKSSMKYSPETRLVVQDGFKPVYGTFSERLEQSVNVDNRIEIARKRDFFGNLLSIKLPGDITAVRDYLEDNNTKTGVV